MLLSHFARFTAPVAAALIAVTTALSAAQPVAAQPPRIPPDARGYQATMILQQYYQNQGNKAPVAPQVSPAPSTTPRSARSITVNVNVPDVPVPASAPTTYVTLRGPDGEVRRFPLARGVEVVYRRGPIVLGPGESTTIRLTPVP